MQRNTRTTINQPNRSTPAQANRTIGGQSQMANHQVNRNTVSQTAGAGNPSTNSNVSTTKATMKKQLKDRLGQAVVSMIFGIFGIIFFIIGLMKMNYDSQYSYTTSPGTAIILFFAFILNIVGFILGIRAKRSTSGRGMAIAGITLTTLPLIVFLIIIVLTILFMVWMNVEVG